MDKTQLFDAAIVAFGPALVVYALALLHKGVAWITAHTKTTIDDNVAAKLLGLADIAVKTTEQTYVSKLKADGSWSPEKHSLAKADALANLKSYLGTKGLEELAKAFGGDIEALLLGTIEAKVYDSSAASSVPSKPAAS